MSFTERKADELYSSKEKKMEETSDEANLRQMGLKYKPKDEILGNDLENEGE